MNIIYKWNDESIYTGGNPPKQYKKGDVVSLHIFPPNILKQHMMYNRIIKCEPRQIPDVTLSISVMAHPQRASFFQGLRDKLGDVPFSIDQNNNLIENCKAAWRLHDPGADFHVVIQDDAIVCNNFKERAIKFITARESERIAYGNPVQGYNFFIRQEFPPDKMREFEKQGCLYDGRNRGGVAICLPVNQIESMLEFFDTIDNRHDDERISQWIVKNKFRMCFPIPSLIDHNDHNPSIAGNKPSVAGNRPNFIRQAWKFIDNEKKVIPKIIHQLWIGPKPPPLKWMQTWKEKNPGWLYKLWDINMINNHRWINQRHIDFYLKQGLWHGVKDVCQYEILYNEGGAFFDADTECVHPINELFNEEHDAYSYWENEEVRPGLIQPLIAAVKGSQFAKELIDGLAHKPVGGIPWRTTGNQYVGEMFRKTSASVKIFPSGYFNPEHYTGNKLQADKVYARHYFGSTDPQSDTYKKGELNEVPKIIHQLWIGPHEMPARWMNTWKEKHPDWEYRLWTEKELSEVGWKNQRWIDFYCSREIWSGAKNIYQYEILFNHGGVFVDADTECLEPIDELLNSGHDAYSYFENEVTRPGYVQPVLAAIKGSKFVEELINDINIKPIVEIERSYVATGNKYVGDMARLTKQDIKIFPSYMFNPEHFTGEKYSGEEKIYSRHFYGSTVENTYEKGV